LNDLRAGRGGIAAGHQRGYAGAVRRGHRGAVQRLVLVVGRLVAPDAPDRLPGRGHVDRGRAVVREARPEAVVVDGGDADQVGLGEIAGDVRIGVVVLAVVAG